MKFKIFFISLISAISLLPQSTYFIKYKENVSRTEVASRIQQSRPLPNMTGSRIKATDISRCDYLVKGISDNIPELSRIIKVELINDINDSDIDFILKQNPDIEYIQPNSVLKISNIPNDSLFSQQWALTKIDALNAWNKTQGTDSVIVGVIDTGVDYLHPDLTDILFFNPGERGLDNLGNDKSSNGLDDDNNGFIDDYMGWDFTDRVGFPFDPTGGDYLKWDNIPMDENVYSHGTAVSGIIGAQTNNQIGIAGVAPNVKILNLRAFDPAGYGEEDDVAAAILYAVKMKAKVINMSFGDNSFSYVLRDVIRYAHSQNVVLVGSSGNSNSGNPHYPSGYSEVISVGNSTQEDYVASTSNWGSTLDLVAPGTGIMTTIRSGKYSLFNGTSAAAPFISASAAMILSLGNYSNEEVRQILKSTSDDIGEAGWDLRSGAGRLNLNKALTVLAPSVVRFHNPLMDFATTADTFTVKASVLSPFFVKYDLEVGLGLNPKTWTNLIKDAFNQVSGENILNLDLKNYFNPVKDTTYTLRLVVTQNNGRTLEERVNFHIIKTVPTGQLISLIPAYYGEKPTISAAFYTPSNCIVRMYYKMAGEISFRFVTLDGFTTNNQFVKKLHYGFIPKFYAKDNTNYELYFEIENLVGLKSTVQDSLNNYFVLKTEESFHQIPKKEMSFSLPPGIIFDKPLNFTSDFFDEVMIRENSNSKVTNHYKLINNSFILLDTLVERIPKDFGNFNNNDRKDLLSFWFYYGYIHEQQTTNSPKLVEKYKQEQSMFWPVLAKDIDKDGKTEIVTVSSDTTLTIYRVNNDFSLSQTAKLTNFSGNGLGENLFDSPNGIVLDIDGDGVNELWLVDTDGDIFSYKILPGDQYVPYKNLQTGFASSSAYIASGDFTGDGKKEIAVLLHSIPEIDVANYHLLIVFNSNFEIIYDRAFIDPASEFSGAFQKSENGLKFADIDNNNTDELILYLFPYAYILKKINNKYQIVFYDEGVNSTAILVSDLNKNGVKEIALPKADKVYFYEFTNADKPLTPSNLSGYSIDSTRIRLDWISNENFTIIYKGTDSLNLIKYDSTFNKYYLDNNVELNKSYYYRVQAYNITNTERYSDFSNLAGAFHHSPAKLLKLEINNDNSVIVHFDNLINTTILNLESFHVTNLATSQTTVINSVTPNNQFSYLVTFREKLNTGNYSLSIHELFDAYNSPVNKDSLTFNFQSAPVLDEFFVQSFEILNPQLIKIVFNLDVDSLSATNPNNYHFQPQNSISDIRIKEGNPKTIYLDLSGGNPVGSVGIEYMLKISNLFSSYSTGKIKISENAGSVLVLTGNASNLSDVYFYPSPARINDGTGKLTFANLPNFVDISIWSLTGKKITDLKERDGNGGFTWNLRDEFGVLVDSGIYIYCMVMRDSKNAELETKLGKVAIIK
ncbi:MAG: S8 family serine peptidase [Ignavibacteriaceae bacterium]